MERFEVIAQRIYFPRKVKKLRDEGRNIVHAAKTYVNAGHTVSKSWQFDEVDLMFRSIKGNA